MSRRARRCGRSDWRFCDRCATVIALQIGSDELWHIMEYTWEELVKRIGECREEVRGEGGGGGLGSVVGVEDD